MKPASTDIRGSNDFLNSVFNGITAALFISDPEGRIVTFNDTFEHLFGVSGDQITGKLCGNVIGCEYVAESGVDCGTSPHCAECALRHAIGDITSRSKERVRFIMERSFSINGSLLHKFFQCTVAQIPWDSKTYALIVIDDITELESARRTLDAQNTELKRLVEQKNRFLGMAAHDLRNPIGSIKGFLEFIRENHASLETEKLLEFLDISYRASRASLQLLDELLDITAIESGHLELRKISFNPDQLLDEIIARNRLFADKKGITIQREGANAPVEIHADPGKLDQVINNLLSNAIKYSPQGSPVTVRTGVQQNAWTVSVIDQGPGIAEAGREKIFKPFGRAGSRPTGGESSTGLGLAIAKRIIDEHRGSISFETPAGGGTVFTCSVPLG